MRTRAVVYADYQAKKAELDAILVKGDGVSVEEAARAETLDADVDSLEAELNQIRKAQELAVKNAARASQQQDDTTGGRPAIGAPTTSASKSDVPVEFAHTRVRSFKGATPEIAVRKAYRFGQFVVAALTGHAKAVKYCNENGIALKKQTESDNIGGGILVPAEFDGDMIDLREQFGTARRLMRNVPMSSDTKVRPRRKKGLQAFAAGEGKAVDESQKGWDSVELIAKKVMVLARYSSELSEDSIINIGDDLMEEIAYAFALFEDECAWNGDGSGAKLKVLGVGNAILAVNPVDLTQIRSLVIGSGNGWDHFTLDDFSKVKGALPRFARRGKGSVSWFASQSFYSTVMEPIMLTAGGVTAAEIAAGRDQEFFMGYPVEICQVLPDETGAGQIACYFGNLQLAADFGDRRQTTIAMSTEAYFGTDEIAIRGTERIDINVHSVGDTEDAGPIIALRTAN